MRSKAHWKAGTSLFAAVLLLGGMAGSSSAQVVGTPDFVGQWTPPFEEGGAVTPRCVPAGDDTSGFTVCKPTAAAAAVLPDGRVFYHNGFESEQNARGPSALSLSPSVRDDQSRVIDLRSGTVQWMVPAQNRGGQSNPNIKPSHKSTDDPLGMAGVPGRPGDGLVGSTWGQLGGPPHDPTSSPDDASKNDGDMFCGDLALLYDGRVLNAGGTDWYNEPVVMDRNRGDQADVGAIELEGLRNAWLFDPRSNSFSSAQPMKFGRWYPGMVEMPDGKVTIFGGVAKLIKTGQLGQVRRSETYDPQTNSWTENYVGPQSENEMPLQPRLHLTPDGKVFYGGAGQTGPFGAAADEALMALQQLWDPQTKTWEVVGLAPLGIRGTPSSIPLQLTPPYDRMTILVFGGTLGRSLPAVPFSTLTTIDENSHLTNLMTGNLHHARWFPSGVLLPDGKVLAVGGADKDETLDPGAEIAVHTAELYDPTTGQWTEVADHARDRTYHNSALLLPDMRVLFGGHAPTGAHYGGANNDQGPPFANNDNDPSFEVFSPPYLFRGARPRITRAQAGIAYGETFPVETPQADRIDSVVLLGLPSPQHVIDSDQRSLALQFERAGGSILQAVAPPNGNVAPPGYYYLVVNEKSPQGPVPSVARIVGVGMGTDPSEAIQPFPDDASAPTGGSATAVEDHSNAAKARQAAGEAASAAPVNRPAASVTQAASTAYEQLSARPAASTSPLPSPGMPTAAIGVAVFAILTGRRWIVSRT
jgi:hypothetical protein